MRNELKIPFESLLNRGVQTVDGFEESFFQDVYRQAFTLVEVICHGSDNNRRNSYSNCEEIQNVIAFTGRRGTGKTSVMLTLANHLGTTNKLNCIAPEVYKGLENYQFYNLPHTDASVLSQNEDLFLIIISKMFRLLQEKFEKIEKKYDEQTYLRQERLKEKICKLYDHYVTLKGNKDIDNKSSYNLMEKLSDKYNVRNEFKKLVIDFTDFLSEQDGKGKKNGFILICVDDIDMSHKKHMEIMQCVHQYFMIPNIIVFTTISFPMISAALQKDFYDAFSLFDTINEKDETYLHLSFEQTNNFVRKIISSDMRITMPSWRKRDYKELSYPKICATKNAKTGGLAAQFSRLEQSIVIEKLEQKDGFLSPKELIMVMLANRTKVYLDVNGSKTHFMEPDSLRGLCDMFYLLYHMNNILPNEENKNEDSSSYYIDLEANRKILLDYLHFKILPENDFSEDINSLVNDFLGEPIERRGRIIWDYYFKCLDQPKIKEKIINIYGKEFFLAEKKKNRIENYSFGELFRILYYASRLEIIDRKLIQFVLASFSFSLPQFVEKEKKLLKSSTDVDNHFTRMRDLFGYTLLGTWNRDLFGGKKVDAVIYVDKLKSTFGSDKDSDKDLSSFCYYLVCILLLSSCSTRESIKIEKGKVDLKPTKEYYSIDVDIDPTAFVMNSLRIHERFEHMKFEFKDKTYELSFRNDKKENKIYALSTVLIDMFSEIGLEIHILDKKYDGLNQHEKLLLFINDSLNSAINESFSIKTKEKKR